MRTIIFACVLFATSLSQTVCAETPKKWFPDHFIVHNPDDYSTSNSDITFLKSADGNVFQGLFRYVTWGQIETTKDTYRWDKIDNNLRSMVRKFY